MRSFVTSVTRALLLIGPACVLSCGNAERDSAPKETTLYARLGKEAGIERLASDFLSRVLADPKINGYFLNSSLDRSRFVSCLVKQLGNAAGGPQKYPDPEAGCRDMRTAHQGLGISRHDFDDMVLHLTATLSDAKHQAQDIETLTQRIVPLAEDVVEDPNNDQSVYQRMGRKPAISALVDAFVARVAADARINGFFTNAARIPRLKTCLVRQVCSIDGPCQYGKEVGATVGEIEPGVSLESPCRSMKEIHARMRDSAGSPVTIEDFNALVEDLGVELEAANVPEAERAALLEALGPLCADIVGAPEECG